jgi:Leucine rich repeat
MVAGIEAFYEIDTKHITCGIITYYDYQNKVTVKECHMDSKLSIDFPNTTFKIRDNTMEVLAFDHIKTVFYLPLNIGGTYSSLRECRAMNCSIKEIFRQNFIGLSTLKKLVLPNNLIERIASDTFKDLKMLELLLLSKKF